MPSVPPAGGDASQVPAGLQSSRSAMRLRRTMDWSVRAVFLGAAVVGSAVLLGILVYLAVYGLRTFKEISPLSFLFGAVWNPDAYGKPSFGLLPLLVGSLTTTALALAIAVPSGIASAVFLSERLKGRVRIAVKTAVELFAGFPSVVLGFFGLVVLAPLIARVFHVNSGLGILNAGLLLALMAMPTIISVADDALRVVPQSYREAAYALGATPWTTAIRVVLPAAKSGILAGTMLGFGRAVGETMAVLMVAGNASWIPKSLLDPARTITTTIAIELGETPFHTTHFYSLFALGLVLFFITLGTNLLAESMIKREKRSFML